MKHNRYLILLIIVAAISGCESGDRPVQLSPADEGAVVRHAKRFSIIRSAATSTVYVRGDRHSVDTTAIFVISPEVTSANSKGRVQYIPGPCERVASLSSIYTQMLFELGRLNTVTGIDNIEYVCNPEIIRKASRDNLPQLARQPEMDLEQTIRLKPDLVFTFGMGDGQMPDRRLAEAGVPVAVSVDHLEETPLARAEWIKFFAEFVDAGKRADSIFSEVESVYLSIKRKVGTASRPTVLTEVKFGDAWYVPGGRSYMAALLADAGASYVWKDDEHYGSLTLSFEEVLAKARNADYWINLSSVRSRSDMLQAEPRYEAFSAFRNGNLFNNTRYANQYGYSPYWESGMIHPERILSDLALIFHGNTVQKDGSSLYYYERLK